MFQFDGVWLMYDGIKEYNRKGSGIVCCHTKFKEPQGYKLELFGLLHIGISCKVCSFNLGLPQFIVIEFFNGCS